MESYSYLLSLSLILLSTKLLGLLTERVHMPQVVGALLAGILLGPSCFGLLENTDFFSKTAEIGVIMLMFTAGIDTDMRELKATGLHAFVVATSGVIFPMILCGGLYFFFFDKALTSYDILEAVFVGAVFTATSVSITVETLNEMGKLKTKTGTILLSAALIDDILGIIVLSVLSGFSSGGSNPLVVLGRIALFFLFTLLVGLLMRRLFSFIAQKHWHSRRMAVWSFAFCLLMSYCAETFFGVADITGAYFAGLILCNVTKARQFVAKKFTVAAYMIFTPVFFANVGMKTDLTTMNSGILLFALLLVLAAIISKIIGCGLGGLLCRMSNHQALVVGIGMISRSEVALMVAQKGMDAGLIDPVILPAILLSIIATSLVTPVLLKLAISRGPELV